MATEQVVEQVAESFEDVAEATRHIDARLVKYFLGGVGVGAAVGFFIGYRFNREKIKAEAFKDSEEEIARIREHYHRKDVARENESEKADLVALTVEKGYSYVENDVEGPPGIADLEALRDRPVEPERPLPPPVPVDPARRVFRSTSTEKDKHDGWNFPREMASRTPDRPHIIHQDEFANNETEYAQVTYTYYAEDDVLVDENEDIINDRDALVGAGSLNRFGHGTDDFNILYVRNPVLELDIEICRSPGSYEVEVLGLEREPTNGPST